MGHDIYARIQGDKEPIYLRMAMWQPAKAFYLALDAYDCYGGVSGNGGSQEYDKTDLSIAKKQFISYYPGLTKSWLEIELKDDKSNLDNLEEIKQYTFQNCISFFDKCIGVLSQRDRQGESLQIDFF